MKLPSAETSKRIFSAIIMCLLLFFVIYLGPMACRILIIFLGILVLDEIQINFLKKNRFEKKYIYPQIFLVLSLVFFLNGMSDVAMLCASLINLILNFILIIYLFSNIKNIESFLSRHSFFLSFLVFLPFVNLLSIFHRDNWLVLLSSILLSNFSADTGAWFFGKNFGKLKLMPSISPKKTVEGLIGGIVTSGILGGLYWTYNFKNPFWENFILFFVFGLISQMGDLVQSKLKREAEIKDSSNLIPGHGGIYDRLDSLIFVMPFYTFYLIIFSK
jgi:phosphatidate cytidylyltransferase